jgi:hypothetical protein
MKEPGLTCGGPAGRRLAVGSQDVAAAASGRAGCCAGRAVTAADPGTAQAVTAAVSSSSVGSLSQAGGFTGTPPAGC